MADKKNENFTRTVVLLIVLMLIGIIYMISNGNKTPEEKNILSLSSGDIQAVIVKNQCGTISLVNMPNGIEVFENKTDNFSQQKMIYLVYTLGHLKYEKKIEGSEYDFGFDKPLAEISIITENETYRMSLGMKNPISGEYYMSYDDCIYIVNGDIGSMLTAPLDNYRNMELFPTMNESGSSKLQRIEIFKNGQLALTLDEVKENTASSFYELSEPVKMSLNWEAVYRQILTKIWGLVPEQFVSETDTGEYGFEDPEYELRLVIDGIDYDMLFAQKDETMYYCKNTRTGLVSELSVDQINFMNTNWTELANDSIYSKSLADMSRVSVSIDDDELIINITGEGDSLTAEINGNIINKTILVDSYSKIKTLPIAGTVNGAESIKSKMLTVSITLRNGKTDIIEFYPVNDRICAVAVNGDLQYVTYTSVVKNQIDMYEKMMGAYNE